MTTDDKARRLLGDAWNYFWRHCPDNAAYYEDYVTSDELDAVMDRADEIISGGAM